MAQPNFYNHLLVKLHKYADKGPTQISYKKARWVMGKLMVPRVMHHIIIREMIFYKLISRKNKQCIILLRLPQSFPEAQERSRK